MSDVGFLPCFSRYCHKEFPPSNFFQESSYVEKVKQLLIAFIDSKDFMSIRQNITAKSVQTIRPNSKGERDILKWCDFPSHNIYRLDYGNSPFKIVFGLTGETKIAYIYIVDTTHKTLPGKGR